MRSTLRLGRWAIEKQSEDAAGGGSDEEEEKDCENEADKRRADAASSGQVPDEHGEKEGEKGQADVGGNVELAAGGQRRRDND